MILDDVIYKLPVWFIPIILIIGFICIYNGKVEIVTGVYCSVLSWMNGVQLGPISLTWIILFILLLSLIKFKFTKKIQLFNKGVLLTICWFIWMLAVLFINPVDKALQWNLLSKILIFITLPILFLQIIGTKFTYLKSFIISYALTTFIGGILIISVNPVNFHYIITGDFLNYHLYQLGRVNYHQYASAFVISIIFLMALLYETKNSIMKIICILGCIFLSYLTVLSGSQQAIGGVLCSAIIYSLYCLIYKIGSRLISISVLGLSVFLIVGVILNFQPLMYKFNPERVSDIGQRTFYWGESIGLISESPILGLGFEYYNLAHNLFLEAILTTGIVGCIFLIFFLCWVSYKSSLGLFRIKLLRDNAIGPLFMAILIAYIYSFIAAQFIGNLLNGYFIYWGGFIICKIIEEKTVYRTTTIIRSGKYPSFYDSTLSKIYYSKQNNRS